MNNPYEILGITENASQDEIKKAYRNLAKKYHPDQYGNNPLKDLADQKMREVNEAYDILMKNASNNSYNSNNTSSSSSDSESYRQVRSFIASNKFSLAEQKLNNIRSRNAEWNYLFGIVQIQKGWYDSGLNYIQIACSLDPNNLEYRQTLNSIRNRNSGYKENYYRTTRNNDMCDTCLKLWCLDTMCECVGCDCIPCI
jgi:molecular chaperone DnaJ